jgi:hypothetical protein
VVAESYDERVERLLRGLFEDSVVEVALAAGAELRAHARRDTYWGAPTIGKALSDLAVAIHTGLGVPLQMSRLAEAAKLTRQAADTALGFYPVRNALPAFASSLVAGGEIGEVELVHLKAASSVRIARAPKTPGYHSDSFPLEEVPGDTAMSKRGRAHYLVASVVTTAGLALPCGFEVIPGRQWNPEVRAERIEQLESLLREPDEDPDAYRVRMAAHYDAKLGAFAGRPPDNALPTTVGELVRNIYTGMGTGEGAVGAKGLLTEAHGAGGWLCAPPATLSGLGGGVLAHSLEALDEARKAGALVVADLCAPREHTRDLRETEWGLQAGDVVYSGADLHERLIANPGPPWEDVTVAGPGPGGVLWFIARGLAVEGARKRPAALIALVDVSGRRRNYSARVCLDRLNEDEDLEAALRIAHADTYTLHGAKGPVQAVIEEIAALGAFDVQAQTAAPREVIISLALCVVAARIAARHIPQNDS